MFLTLTIKSLVTKSSKTSFVHLHPFFSVKTQFLSPTGRLQISKHQLLLSIIDIYTLVCFMKVCMLLGYYIYGVCKLDFSTLINKRVINQLQIKLSVRNSRSVNLFSFQCIPKINNYHIYSCTGICELWSSLYSNPKTKRKTFMSCFPSIKHVHG